ncbi:MAG: YihA family ribosome biogenesis GTP-binding protein [Saprospiraceae bacterium]|nr:YihA family ribosome biogenesis GTP-binding protein [Saprospiraceae bacterium]
MDFNEVYFVGSYDREGACPKTPMPEFAFIGRSNVGKSSLINMLTGRVNLARVSKQPGKTQIINFFNVDQKWHLVDLPGYGYAKISKKKRAAWEKMIERYLVTREQLVTAFVLLDSRIPLQKIDLEFINWMGDRSVPFNIIYTKVDKLKQSEVKGNIKRIEQGLLQYWNELPQQFISSAEKGTGREEILQYIEGFITQ